MINSPNNTFSFFPFSFLLFPFSCFKLSPFSFHLSPFFYFYLVTFVFYLLASKLLIGTDINKDFLHRLIDKAESLINRKIRYLILSPSEAVSHLGDGKGAMLIWKKEL